MTVAKPTPHRGWVTIPNAVTLLRLLLVVPVFILIVRDVMPELTVALLVVFGASDWVDGYLARRLDQMSIVGALFDPIADRVGVAAIALALVVGGHLPAWVALVIVGVDAVLLVVSILTRLRVTPASVLGKVRTAVLMVGLVLVAAGLLPAMAALATLGVILASVGAILHAVAGAGYLRAIIAGGR